MYKESLIDYVSAVKQKLQRIANYFITYLNQSSSSVQASQQFRYIPNKQRRQYIKLNHEVYRFKRLTYAQIEKIETIDKLLRSVSGSLQETIQRLKLIIQKLQQPVRYYQNIRADYVNKLKIKQNRFNPVVYQQGYQLKIFQDLFMNIYYSFFEDSLTQLLNQPAKKIAVRLLQMQTKLSFLPLMMHELTKFKPDITTYYPHEQRYSHAWGNIQFMDQGQDESKFYQIHQDLQLFKRLMMITTSAVVTEQDSIQIQILRKVIFGVSFPIFWFADDESHLRCYKIWRNPNLQNVNKVWSLPQSWLVARFQQRLVYPSIHTNLFLYIPAPINYNTKLNVNTQILQFESSQFPSIFDKPVNYQSAIRVLLVCHENLQFSNLHKQSIFGCFSTSKAKETNYYQTIMIFIPGGGFVSLSSETAQAFTRKWSKELKIPIFSIDYRKPPQFRFPIAVYDCLMAYKFIIQKIYHYVNIRPKNIILAGDSSGGNLALSLQALLMQQKYNVLPTAMFLAYPAADLRLRFSPSRINSFHESLLLPTLLILCLHQYLGQDRANQWHPLASPLLLSEYFIRMRCIPPQNATKEQKNWPTAWPKTVIMVGKKDPLYDDSLRLLQRMRNSNVDAKLLVYNQFSHAFLGLSTMVPGCNRAIDDAVKQLRKLINN